MILPDYLLKDWAGNGGLTPYDPECVNPASVDLRWSGRYRTCTHLGWSDVKESDELIIQPGHLHLLDTMEVVNMPIDCCGMITLKSSMGRQGLEHLHAGFFDPGFCGTATLEMHVVGPHAVTLVKGQRVVQITIMEMIDKPNNIYAGKYQGDLAPTPSK